MSMGRAVIIDSCHCLSVSSPAERMYVAPSWAGPSRLLSQQLRRPGLAGRAIRTGRRRFLLARGPARLSSCRELHEPAAGQRACSMRQVAPHQRSDSSSGRNVEHKVTSRASSLLVRRASPRSRCQRSEGGVEDGTGGAAPRWRHGGSLELYTVLCFVPPSRKGVGIVRPTRRTGSSRVGAGRAAPGRCLPGPAGRDRFTPCAVTPAVTVTGRHHKILLVVLHVIIKYC